MSLARFFRQIPYPRPATASPAPTLDILLDHYANQLVEERSNEPPILSMFSLRQHPDIVSQMESTLSAAFRRPYRHTLYTSASPVTPDHDMALFRQWIHIPRDAPIGIVTFVEAAKFPTADRYWSNYWMVINNKSSKPPPHFWRSVEPLMLCQNSAGMLQWPGAPFKLV